MTKKFTLITILSLSLGIAAVHAQHELSIHGGGGLSGLRYSPTLGSQNNGFGGHLGVGYGYFITPKWSILTGAEFALYNSKFKLPALTTQSAARDNHENIDFTFRSTINDYEEKQRGGFVQIPLMVRYEFGSARTFYAAGGVKAGFSRSGKTNGTIAGTIRNEGIYLEPPPYSEEDLWFRGFGTFPNSHNSNRNYSGTFDFKTSFMLSLEAGMKFNLRQNIDLYAGAYFDYGLNNVYQSPTAPAPHFVAYHNPAGADSRNATFEVNSVMRSQYTSSPNATSRPFVDKLAPIAVGVKVRLAFNFGVSVQRDRPVDAVTAATPQVTQPAYPPVEQPVVPPVVEEPVIAEQPVVEEPVVEETRHATSVPTVEQPVAVEPVPTTPRTAIIDAIEQPVNDYRVSQYTPLSRQTPVLDEIIVLLKQHPEIKFHIYGHTCDLGDDAINEITGLLRAERAKTYMISQGIDENRILGTTSKLYREPLVPNSNEENRRKNRRVELKVIEN